MYGTVSLATLPPTLKAEKVKKKEKTGLFWFIFVNFAARKQTNRQKEHPKEGNKTKHRERTR